MIYALGPWPAADPADLRAIGHALTAVVSAENAVSDAVTAARESGRSWNEIDRPAQRRQPPAAPRAADPSPRG